MPCTKNIGDPNLNFISGFRTTGLKGNLYVRVDGHEDLYDLDDFLGWTYKENVVCMMFRTPDNKGCARVEFCKDDCIELVRKLTKILQEVDNIHKPI